MIGNIKPFGQGHMRPVLDFKFQFVYFLPIISHCFLMCNTKKVLFCVTFYCGRIESPLERAHTLIGKV